MEILKRTIPRFRVAERAEGQPFIVIEQSGGDDLPIFMNTIRFDLWPGITFEEANAISRYLISNIPRIYETISS